MTRPRVICHMHTLLNGKVDGIANITDVGWRAQREYFNLILGPERFYDRHRGWMCGRGTSMASMGDVGELDLPEPAEPVPPGDFIADPDADMHYFAVDSAGVLPWQKNTTSYFEVDAHVVALLSGAATDAYKAHLRRIGVSYLIAGEEQLDLVEVIRKIGATYAADELILGGGPRLNWSMLRAGLVDELSLVLMPTADAEGHTSSLFEATDKYSTPAPYEFTLKASEPLDDGSLWIRYDVVGKIREEPNDHSGAMAGTA